MKFKVGGRVAIVNIGEGNFPRVHENKQFIITKVRTEREYGYCRYQGKSVENGQTYSLYEKECRWWGVPDNALSRIMYPKYIEKDGMLVPKNKEEK